MKLADRLPSIGLIALLILGVGVIGSKIISPSSGSNLVDVKVPALSPQALAGKKPFDANCALCHGENGGGSDQGPPLIHDTYNPGHHGDPSFFMAAERGVKSHHWGFGNMPPQPQVKKWQVEAIIRYIRELQLANGIVYRQHQM